MRDLSSWLPDLAPPPGGLARLCRRVEAPRRRLAPVWGGVAGCGVMVLVLFCGVVQQRRERAALVQTLRRAVQPQRPGTLRVIGGVALGLESGQPGVQLYLVQSTRNGETPPRQ